MTFLLVIESTPNASDSLTTRLEQEGYLVTSVSSYIQAIAALKSNHPQVIIFSHNPPHCDGLKYLQEFSETRKYPNLPKLVVSELGDRTCFRQAMAHEADDFLPTPYTTAEIVESIETLLERSKPLSAQELLDQASNSWSELLTHGALKQQFNYIKQNTEDPEAASTLYLIGIDQLNWFRSTLGSQLSNTVIDILASRLIDSYWDLDKKFVVAKIDDHQFAILPNASQELAVQHTLTPMWHRSISQPIEIQGEKILMTTSVAAIEFEFGDDCEFEMLMSQARKLLKHVHAQGGNQFCTDWFCKTTESSHQFSIATNLLRGLTENEFHAYYQPQLDLKTGNFVGVEALVRWHHHDWGTLDPGHFLPVAEETGSIIQIDERVLRLACQSARKWQDTGYQPLTIAVNLSAFSFNRPNLSELVRSILEEFNISPQWLALEITESVLVQDKQRAAKIMSDLKKLGVSIVLDDFGVGYSSLSYLQQFPLDTLKIDQSFIQKVDTNQGNAAITEAVIKLAHSLNLNVIAEGVERVAEREFLRQRDCDVIQGYLVSHPVPESVFESFLTSRDPIAQVA